MVGACPAELEILKALARAVRCCLGCGCTLGVAAVGRCLGAGLCWELMGSH